MDMIEGHDFGWKHHLARRIVPKRLDNLILHSPETAEWYQTHYAKGLIMPILADERRIRPELERVLPLSERLRPSDMPIVAFVGRLVGLKNVPTLIRAFEPFQDQAMLVIIGDGPDRAALEKRAPKALFTGMLSGDELLAWYNLIDILVLPSTQEAYGTVTGEALMAGAKVIVSQKAGSSSLVRERENGFIVDPLDASSMTVRIGTLLEEVTPGRPLSLRPSLHPYHFESCVESLLQELNRL
jgi:glycosyltransferase involved in cell wall biosynthesis